MKILQETIDSFNLRKCLIPVFEITTLVIGWLHWSTLCGSSRLRLGKCAALNLIVLSLRFFRKFLRLMALYKCWFFLFPLDPNGHSMSRVKFHGILPRCLLINPAWTYFGCFLLAQSTRLLLLIYWSLRNHRLPAGIIGLCWAAGGFPVACFGGALGYLYLS